MVEVEGLVDTAAYRGTGNTSNLSVTSNVSIASNTLQHEYTHTEGESP